MERQTVQDVRNVHRINQQLRTAKLLSEFVALGFRNFSSLKTICNVYDQSITTDEVKMFWYVNNTVSEDLCNRVEAVINKLKDN